MTTEYTPILKLALPVEGELSGTWGDVVNDNITSMVEQAVAGRAVIDSWAANSHVLTTADGITAESRCAMLEFTDSGTSLSADGTVVCPTLSKMYIAKNSTGNARNITLTTAAGTGVSIPQGRAMLLFCDGTNVAEAVTNINSLTAGGYTVALTGAVTTAGDLTTVGANALTLTTTGATNVTFPTTGTLATLAGTETLSNKTLVSPSITDPTLSGDISAANVTISGNTIIGNDAADTLTINATTTSDLLFTDDTYDIGKTGATRPRDVFASRNAEVGGTLGVTGNTTLSGTAEVTGDFAVNTNKVNVTAASGNTTIAGTLGVTGATTATGGLNVDTISEITAAGGVTIDSVLLKDDVVNATDIETSTISANDGTLAINIANTTGNVGIGMTPAKILDLQATDNLALRFYNGVSFKAGFEVATTAGDMISTSVIDDLAIRSQSDMLFSTGGSVEKMRIDTAGNVGIGTSSPSHPLTIQGSGTSGDAIKIIGDSTNDSGRILWRNNVEDTTTAIISVDSSKNMVFSAGGTTERVRIDSSGSLLVGTTTSRPAEFSHPDGFAVRADVKGQIQNTVTDATTMITNRDGTDGTLIEFRKEGTAVGSIGNNTDFYIASQDGAGVRFSATQVLPCSESGATQNGSRDLGGSSARFKDLYLSGAAKVIGSPTGTSQIWLGDTDDNNRGTIVYDHNTDHMSFKVNGAERLRIDSSGNVGIGTSLPGTFDQRVNAPHLVVGSGANASGLTVYSGPTNQASINFATGVTGSQQYDGGLTYIPGGSAHMAFHVSAGSEKMRLDSAGNLLVGKTASSSATAGHELLGYGRSIHTANATTVQIVNRLGSDGDISIFQKDGATAGSIGSAANGTEIYLAGSGANTNGVFCSNGNSLLSMKAGVLANGTQDLGASSYKWKDLHLSGTAYVGGNVGIGTSSPDSILQAANTANSTNYISYEIGNNGVGANNKGGFAIYELGSLAASITYARDGSGHTDINANALVFNNATNTQENMRIDSSGNLLVGKTALNTNAAGLQLENDGYLSACRDGGNVLLVNRKSSDGALATFQKDGTTVGSIGTTGGKLYIGSNDGSDAFLRFESNEISPCAQDGSFRDNVINLGKSVSRFNDIYATNGTIQTSDRNEKQDILEITTAETAVAKACKGLLRSFRWKDAVAEKGDDARIHFGIIAQDLQDAFTAEGLDAGRYAMFTSDTWWETETEVAAVEAVEEVTDEDGNVTTEAVEAKDAYTRTDTFDTLAEAPAGATERTRLGVRYSELLAFIIAAI